MSPDPQYKKQSDISVALATYNGARFLSEQLESLAQQTLLPLELIVTDDGSTDNTLEIVETFAQTAPFPVRAIRNQKRYGYADNFFHAASLCQGKWIAFCDQDDVWFESKLAVIAMHFADAEDVSLVVHSAETWDGRTRLGGRFPHFDSTTRSVPGTLNPFKLMPGFAMVFRSDLLRIADFNDRPGCIFGLSNKSVMAHDSWIWLLAASTGTVVTLNEVLAFYRQHPTNTVGAPRKKSVLSRLKVAAKTVHYGDLAVVEGKAAEILRIAATRVASPLAAVVKKNSEQMQRRSQMNMHRAVLYSSSSSLVQRLKAFVQIAKLGGYMSDRTSMRLGRNAGFKDAFLGVPGLFPKS